MAAVPTARSATVGGGGVGAAVLHGRAYFHTGRKAVEEQTSHFGFQHGNEGVVFAQVIGRPMNGGGKLAF